MLVFLSWSGKRSRRVAEALRSWLPNVIQAVEPWMSSEDIDKGSRWSTDIAQQLEKARVGILCVTPDNLTSPWLLFEAGALSKSLEKTYVCPFLLGLKATNLEGPLVQFQASEATIIDTLKLLQSINAALGERALPEATLRNVYAKWWPDLDLEIRAIEAEESSPPTQRAERGMIEETLLLVRELAKQHQHRPAAPSAIGNPRVSPVVVDPNLVWSGGPGPDGKPVVTTRSVRGPLPKSRDISPTSDASPTPLQRTPPE